MITISIIGTAGRNGIDKSVNYHNMINVAEIVINKIIESNNTNMDNILVCSGGAALSDHVAISLYLQDKIKHLNLYLPCQFNMINKKFIGSISNSANKYHHNFSKQFNIDSLNEISMAVNKGANINEYNGFFARNDQLALSNYIIAFSPNKDKTISINPKNPILTSGTKYTWNKAKGNKIYIPI